MKKIKILCSLFIPVLFCSWYGLPVKNTIQYGDTKVIFQTRDGMLDGPYISYYANGKKKAQGTFSGNQRVGKWVVWDPGGNVLVKREYKNSYEYRQLFPESGSKPTSVPVYSLIRNENGLHSYFDFTQKDVILSKRIWRDVGYDDESSFFHNDNVYHALIDSIAERKISIYDLSSDDLQLKMTGEGIKKIMDTAGKEIIGFKIKEDWFFDSKRKTSETRIVAICPIVCKKDTTRIADDDYSFGMGWFHFPEIRNTLNSFPVSGTDYPTYIETADDIFFFRYFPSEIYKESNVYDRKLSDYLKPGSIPDEQNRIEIGMIESEHDLWVNYGK